MTCPAGSVTFTDWRVKTEHAHHSVPLRLATWNIERGYKLAKVISLLRHTNADILCLQEIDVGCERSGGIDTGRAIGKALRMNCMFVCEFEELHSPLRDAHTQGGGCHGHAIFTRYDFVRQQCGTIVHAEQPLNWERDGHRLLEPRRGRRVTQFATIACGDDRDSPSLLCYNTHAELFCGVLDRVVVLGDLFAHSREMLNRHGLIYQAIMGDLNTLGHSIARLSPKYCRDRLRVLSLGCTEPEWMAENVLYVSSTATDRHNSRLQSFGLDPRVVRDAVNPGFFDPFDLYYDVTVVSYRGLFQGKLDWTLLYNLRVLHKHMDNVDFDASDHRLLLVQAQFITDPHQRVSALNIDRIVHQTRTAKTVDWVNVSALLAVTFTAVLAVILLFS